MGKPSPTQIQPQTPQTQVQRGHLGQSVLEVTNKATVIL